MSSRLGDSPSAVRRASRPVGTLLAVGMTLLIVPTVATLLFVGRLPDVEAYAYEWYLLAALAVLRLGITLATRKKLIPILDLPLLGLVFVITGVGSGLIGGDVQAESPLDPALFLIYALLTFSMKRRVRNRAVDLVFFGLGFLGMYGIVLFHLYVAQDRDLVERRQLVLLESDELNIALAGSLFKRADTDALFTLLEEKISEECSSNPVLAAEEYFVATRGEGEPLPGGRTVKDSYEVFVTALTQQATLLREVLDGLGPDSPIELVDQAIVRLNSEFEAARDRTTEVANRIAEVSTRIDAAESRSQQDEVLEDRWYQDLNRDVLFTTLEEHLGQHEVHRAAVEGHAERIRTVHDQAVFYRGDMQRLASQRLAIAILALATLILITALRYRFEEEVHRREAARAAMEVRNKEREKENWIALTAGLTHTIGNDILAYDAYGEEALDALEPFAGQVPEVIGKNLRFIHESNKARLGFIKFLDEFARARKETGELGRLRPRGLAPVALEPMLHEVRDQVGEVEVIDLPAESKDPQVMEQRSKFLELPFEVRFDSDSPQADMLRSGKPGILRFFFYELIKNALRNCSGNRPIEVEITRSRERVRLRFINDLKVQEVSGADGRRLYRLPRLSAMQPCEEQQLRREVEEILAHCFEPGRGGGTGLGLFLIRYFAREYYSGAVTASIHDWNNRLVSFELDLPDDLESLAEKEAS